MEDSMIGRVRWIGIVAVLLTGCGGASPALNGNAEFSTPLLGFTDDVELYSDGKVLHVRSSSRLGVRDFNVNRKRVESLRAQLEK
jgi:hypothetical protein